MSEVDVMSALPCLFTTRVNSIVTFFICKYSKMFPRAQHSDRSGRTTRNRHPLMALIPRFRCWRSWSDFARAITIDLTAPSSRIKLVALEIG